MVNCAMSRREKEFWEKQPIRPSPYDKSRPFKPGKRGRITVK